jgi:hypothetical protein
MLKLLLLLLPCSKAATWDKRPCKRLAERGFWRLLLVSGHMQMDAHGNECMGNEYMHEHVAVNMGVVWWLLLLVSNTLQPCVL